ncbi:MAG TPA: glycosyltransferase [Solirubrobacterales bacterium]
MIAFGCAVSDPAVYERLAGPGIERAAEPGSPLFISTGLPIRDAYNEILDEAAILPGLEALVLLHQDFELTDDSLPGRVRQIFADPRVGLAGSLGARDVTLHLWLSSRELYGAVAAPGIDRRFSSGPQEVEGVDGALLVLAPWVVRGLRFGGVEAGGFHGYDVDIAMRVRAYGGTVICDDIPHFHHREPKDDYEAQRHAGIVLARMWDPALRPPEWGPAFQL